MKPSAQVLAVLERCRTATASESALGPRLLAGLRTMGQRSGTDMVARMGEIFRGHRPHLRTLRNAVENGDGPTVAEETHFLKGSARTLGAMVLNDLCALLEEVALAGDPRGAELLLAAVEKEYERIIKEFERAERSPPA